jgi:hypothetical protein
MDQEEKLQSETKTPRELEPVVNLRHFVVWETNVNWSNFLNVTSARN